MKVFIIGARGYIGAHVVKILKKSGHIIIAADLSDIESNDISKYVDNYIDWDINGIIPKKIPSHQSLDAIIHMAALVSVEESIFIPSAYYRTNLFGTLNVLNTFPGAKFIFASTGAAFSPTSP